MTIFNAILIRNGRFLNTFWLIPYSCIRIPEPDTQNKKWPIVKSKLQEQKNGYRTLENLKLNTPYFDRDTITKI